MFQKSLLLNSKLTYNWLTIIKKKNFSFSSSQFSVGELNGFLPRDDPLEVLPGDFHKLEELLQRMPFTCKDGSEGLLRYGQFGDAILNELPDYSNKIDKITDERLISALFRDYAFATSGYILEPCGMFILHS